MDTPETVRLSLSYFFAYFVYFFAGLNLLCGGKYTNATTFDLSRMLKCILLFADYTEDSDKCPKIIAKTPKWTKALESNQFLLTFADLLDSL